MGKRPFDRLVIYLIVAKTTKGTKNNLKFNIMKAINKNNIPVGMIKTFFTTGKDRNGKKFRIESTSLNYIQCVNAYSDKIVWVILENNKRIKLY